MTSLTNFYHVTQIILQMWSCDFDNSSISIREVIIASILQRFDQKNHFFLGVVLVQVQ